MISQICLQKQKHQNKVFSSLFFSLFPLVKYQVHGNSMQPQYPDSANILVQKKWFLCKLRINEVIILKDPRTNERIIKRIKYIKRGRFFVVGDNAIESTDSRTFGLISPQQIIGKVIYKIDS